MKPITPFSLATLLFFSSHFEAKALVECPFVNDVLKTMKCTEAYGVYTCHYDHNNWSGGFESQVDITQEQGFNQYVGTRNGGCAYKYETSALEVNYILNPTAPANTINPSMPARKPILPTNRVIENKQLLNKVNKPR